MMTQTPTRRPWTDEDDELLRQFWNEDVTISEISRRIGRTPCAVKKRRLTLRLPPRSGRGGRPRRLDYDMIREMWDAGASAEEIADAVGSTPLTIQSSHIRTRAGLASRSAHRNDGLPMVVSLDQIIADAATLSPEDREELMAALKDLKFADES